MVMAQTWRKVAAGDDDSVSLGSVSGEAPSNECMFERFVDTVEDGGDGAELAACYTDVNILHQVMMLVKGASA